MRSRRLRLSHRLAAFPEWVRDYVLVHELAHLQEPNHSPAFWRLVHRYPLAERARGYLMASGLEPPAGLDPCLRRRRRQGRRGRSLTWGQGALTYAPARRPDPPPPQACCSPSLTATSPP